MKAERIATYGCLDEQARAKHGENFDSLFVYRRGSEHIVRKKKSAVAKFFLGLEEKSD
jgi:hypothetical protein